MVLSWKTFTSTHTNALNEKERETDEIFFLDKNRLTLTHAWKKINKYLDWWRMSREHISQHMAMSQWDERTTKETTGHFEQYVRFAIYTHFIDKYTHTHTDTHSLEKPLSVSNNLFIEHNFSSDNYCLVIIIIKITTEMNEQMSKKSQSKRNEREEEKKNQKIYI